MFSLNKLFGITQNASETGYLVDHLLEFCHWFMTVLFVGWSCFFFYTLWRFHKSRNPVAIYHGVRSHMSTHVEFSVVLIEAALLLGFAIPLWGKRVNGEQFMDNPNALRIHAVAEQFAWNFHYAGADGVFGQQNVSFVQANNPLGIDPNDPAGKDDLVSKNELHVVNKKQTVVEVTSKDVIHNFALPNMRIAQDAIPGSRVPIWYRPIKAGTFEIICGQLCGSGHYAMRALMMVEDQATYDSWVKDTVQLQHPDLVKAPEVAPAK